MTMKLGALRQIFLQEDLNFLLTNRVPRIALTRFVGWYSQIRSPLLARFSIAVWRLFTELDLSDARSTKFNSLHECFTRQLKDGAREVDQGVDILSSPSDAIVGACGKVEKGQLFQAKGMPYSLRELFGPHHELTPYESGTYVTLRLTSAMYHRFHAPQAGTLEHVSYMSGDCWNVNPIALQRVEGLFCRNERALLRMRLASGHTIALVPVAAILVASIRLHALNVLLHLRWKGANEMPCNAPYAKGEEMGWFQHGSTIIVFAPPGFELAEGIESGKRLRMGQALMKIAGSAA